MAIDEQKVQEAVGKVFGELAGAGPMTPNELASRTGTVERCVREWLRGVAAEAAAFNIVLEARP